MAYGLKVSNSNGFLVIDDNFRNYEVKETGTVACPGTYNFAAYGPGVLVLVKNENPALFLTVIYAAGSASVRLVDVNDNPVSGTITYALLNLATSTDTNNYGFRVFNSAGELVFTSARNYMRLRDSYTVVQMDLTPRSFGIPFTNPWVVANAFGTPISYYIAGGGSATRVSLVYVAFRTYQGVLHYKITTPTYPALGGSNVFNVPIRFQLGV